jgi:hypothetical protein
MVHFLMQVQDTVVQLPTAVDSIAQVIGGDAGTLVATKLALGLGLVVKLVTEVTKPIIGRFVTLSPVLKAVVALLWAQAAVFSNQFLAAHGGPAIPADPSMLGGVIDGMVVWAAAMGYNGLKDAVIKRA